MEESKPSAKYNVIDMAKSLLAELPGQPECQEPPKMSLKPKRCTKSAKKTTYSLRNSQAGGGAGAAEEVWALGECALCLERLGGGGALASTRCGHVFCARCLLHALASERRCPTCRAPLRTARAWHPLYLHLHKLH